MERQNLASIIQIDSLKECNKGPPIPSKPKASPKTGFLSALKKENRSRSNSSVIAARRYSTENTLGDRLDSIGRRLSRDLLNSPPDLTKRIESIGKYGMIASRRFTPVGLSKSNEALSDHYDVSKEAIEVQSANTHDSKKSAKITFECYDRKGFHDWQQDSHDVDNADLCSNYSPIDLELINQTTSNSVDRPPIPQKIIKNVRQKSLDNLNLNDNDINSVKISSNIGSGTKVNQRSRLSLERLSREDLLRLSHNSQSEIHEYLKGPTSDSSEHT